MDIDAATFAELAEDLDGACVPTVVEVTDEDSVPAAVAGLAQPRRLLVHDADIARFGRLLTVPLAD